LKLNDLDTIHGVAGIPVADLARRRLLRCRSARAREGLAESILEQIGDAVIHADHTGTIMRWNHAAAALFG
jgi:PAS domain-containing protein